MTTFKHPAGKTYRYDFWWNGERYTGNTRQTTKAEADLVEADFKKKLRLRAGGLEPPAPTVSPFFQDWSEVYLEDVFEQARTNRIKRPDRIQDLLRVVLRFWGRRPPAEVTGRWAARADEPYHDLRLNDPVDDPYWIVRFELWMKAKKIAGQTKNQYRSTMSQLYAFALRPEYRQRTNVAINPFVGVPRDRGGERTSTVTVAELQAWLQHASYHVRLAVAIAALAPKLRLENILKLKWSEHVGPEYRYLTVHEHKTEDALNRPLVVAVDEQLRIILEDARKRNPRAKYVVVYRGRPVKSIRGGVKAAAEAAGLSWGRFKSDGVTFHTVRHTMATMLAELSDLDGEAPLSESQRKETMGHKRLETTQRYTHIRPTVERRGLERLSNVTPIAAIVTQPWTRASRKTIGTSTGTGVSARQKSLSKSRKPRSRRRDRKKAG